MLTENISMDFLCLALIEIFHVKFQGVIFLCLALTEIILLSFMFNMFFSGKNYVNRRCNHGFSLVKIMLTENVTTDFSVLNSVNITGNLSHLPDVTKHEI